MKEKLLKEKGGAKVYIIIIAVLVILCVAVGAFAVINMNKDKDDEKTSKKNETNTSKSNDDEKEDKKNNKNESKDNNDDEDDDEEESKATKYSGTIDMTKLMGTDELKDTTWTLTVEGDDDTISKMVIKAELAKYFKKTFEDAVGTSDAYTYEEFVELIHQQLDSTMGSLGTEMASELGVADSKITSNVNWVDDETLEIEIDLSKTKRSDYKGVEDDDSVIEFFVESLKEQDIDMKKSK